MRRLLLAAGARLAGAGGGGVTGNLRAATTGFALASVLACVAPSDGDWIACSFFPVEDQRDVVDACARRGPDGALVFAPAAFEALAARRDEPAAIALEGTFYYLSPAGVAVPVLPFDNGPDPFVEGLARTRQEGKVGFVDRALNVVVAPRWDFAFPFANGRAVVCDGCSFRALGDGHQEVVGGRWGVIDTSGAVVVPVVHARDALDPLREP